MAEPLILRVDAVQIIVPDLEAGLAFYRDKLGHELRWRNESAAGLAMPHSDTELVIQTALDDQETDLLVESADGAAQRFAEAGGKVIVPPSDIPVGRVAVVQDPWGNRLVLLDLSKGTFDTDAEGNVTGVNQNDA
ncbi:MAG: VOC family protein [Chloroflexi bacterium]|nr:VOC family protein [Chloroflexota bacterium]